MRLPKSACPPFDAVFRAGAAQAEETKSVRRSLIVNAAVHVSGVSRMRCFRWFAGGTVLVIGFVLAQVHGGAPARSGAHERLRTYLDAHCISCHGADVKKGGLDLESLALD